MLGRDLALFERSEGMLDVLWFVVDLGGGEGPVANGGLIGSEIARTIEGVERFLDCPCYVAYPLCEDGVLCMIVCVV